MNGEGTASNADAASLLAAKAPRRSDLAPIPAELDVRLPADRFLWAVLKAPGHRRGARAGAPLAPGLLPQLSEQVHVDPDSLAAVAASLGNGRLLVCALEHDALSPYRATALRLSPGSIPPCEVGTGELDPGDLDLLVGGFTPLPVQRRVRLRHAMAAGAVTVCALLAALGLSRRAAAWSEQARQARTRASQVAVAVDPMATTADLPALAEEAQRELEALATLGTPAPIAPVLAQLLAAWPAHAAPTSLSVEEGTILISVLVTGDPAGFLGGLRPPAGWRAQEPRLASMDGGTQITLVLERGGAP